MGPLPSTRLPDPLHRDEPAGADLPFIAADLEALSTTRAGQAARRLREEDRARSATSVPPPPPRFR
jgi:hypothetical protein